MNLRILRHIILLLAACLFQSLAAQSTLSFELGLEPEDFILHRGTDGRLEVEARWDGYRYPDGESAPALPVRTITLLLPGGTSIEDYSFETEILPLAEGVVPVNAPLYFPGSFPDHTADKGKVFEGSFPEKVLSEPCLEIQRGHHMAVFTFSPFIYDSGNSKLSMVRKLKLKVEYRQDGSRKAGVRSHPHLRQDLESRLNNPGDLERFYPLEEGGRLKSESPPLDYLVVTTEDLKADFAPLVEWKIRKGIRAEIVTMEEIDRDYEASTIQLKIKLCLADYYSKRGIYWVLLGGDSDVVPIQGCYNQTDLGDVEVEEYNIPTDLFYACFDKRFDWNSVEDDKIGQPYRDGHDLLPEVYISRLPMNTPEQVRDFVKKLLRYEQEAPLENFGDRMLLSGVQAWNSWSGKSDSHHRSESFFSKYIPARWKGEKFAFYDTGTDFPGNQEYQVTAQNLKEQLEKGYGFFQFTGHGNTHFIVMESGNSFFSEDALELDSPYSGLVLSNACHVNAYDSIDPCLSEGFLRNPQGGAIAFFGSSRLGYGNPDSVVDLGPSLQYNAILAEYLYAAGNEKEWKNFASIAGMTKTEFVHNGSAGGAYNYLLYAINPMGDPEMHIHTGKLSRFENVRIYRIRDEVTVNTGGEEKCRICLTSLDLTEGYLEVSEGRSYHTFTNAPDDFQLTITAPGYLPYRYIYMKTNTLESLTELFRVYPNPVNRYLYLESLTGIATARLYDLTGRLMKSMPLEHGTSVMEMDGLTAGSYILRLEVEGNSTNYKILKQ